jgi:hypothetical protein
MRISTLALGCLLLVACNKPSSTPPADSPKPATEEPATDETPAADPDVRPEITAAACEEQGGKVVGDIGDGAIHQPDYRCPESGEPPVGTIIPEPGGPVAIEGAVCCR